MSSDGTVISARNLAKTYKVYSHPLRRVIHKLGVPGQRGYQRIEALRDVSFDIQKGEAIGIIGRNGSGKSTLLQLMCGILRPSAGSIAVEGRISALLELGAGFHPEFTGRENAYFLGALMGFTKAEMDERFADIASFADIGEFIDQPVRIYSSGMYVRLAFAVAVSAEPDILVVDEALAVGDIGFQAKCMSALRRCLARGVTTIFVSHDLNTVRSLCTRAIYLDRGCVRRVGDAASVAEEYWRDMREPAVATSMPSPKVPSPHSRGGTEFHSNQEFQRRVEDFRQGSGEARFVDVELLDENNTRCTDVEYGQPVRLRLYVLFNASCEVAVSYYFRDGTQTMLAGSTTNLEGFGLVKGNAGDKKIVEFATTLPFAGGGYNVLAILSVPLIQNRSAAYVDFVENACTFNVRERAPVRLWSKMYVKNKLSISDG